MTSFIFRKKAFRVLAKPIIFIAFVTVGFFELALRFSAQSETFYFFPFGLTHIAFLSLGFLAFKKHRFDQLFWLLPSTLMLLEVLGAVASVPATSLLIMSFSFWTLLFFSWVSSLTAYRGFGVRVFLPTNRKRLVPTWLFWLVLFGGSTIIALSIRLSSVRTEAHELPIINIAIFVTVIGFGLLFVSFVNRITLRAQTRKWLRSAQPVFAMVNFGPGCQPCQRLYTDAVAIGEQFFVLDYLHRAEALNELFKDFSLVLISSETGLDHLRKLSSLKAFVYTQNSKFNVGVRARYRNQKHIFIGHGDSDKQSSSSPLATLYTHFVLAGQAAIDRMREVNEFPPRTEFVPGGIPNAPHLVRHKESLSTTWSTVLYAPTWWRGQAHNSYGSIRFAPQVVRILVDLGLRVIFRPHPFSLSDIVDGPFVAQTRKIIQRKTKGSGLTHRYSPTRGNFEDDVNESDFLLTDISSTISTYLYSQKPIFLLNIESNLEELPPHAMARTVAYSVNSLNDLEENIKWAMNNDVLAASRRELGGYFLGGEAALQDPLSWAKTMKKTITG